MKKTNVDPHRPGTGGGQVPPRRQTPRVFYLGNRERGLSVADDAPRRDVRRRAPTFGARFRRYAPRVGNVGREAVVNPQYAQLQALFNLCDRQRHQLAERNRQLEEELERLQRIIDDVAPCNRG